MFRMKIKTLSLVGKSKMSLFMYMYLLVLIFMFIYNFNLFNENVYKSVYNFKCLSYMFY